MRVGWMDGWPLMVRANGEWPSERSVVYARRKTITIHDPVFKNGPVLHSPVAAPNQRCDQRPAGPTE